MDARIAIQLAINLRFRNAGTLWSYIDRGDPVAFATGVQEILTAELTNVTGTLKEGFLASLRDNFEINMENYFYLHPTETRLGLGVAVAAKYTHRWVIPRNEPVRAAVLLDFGFVNPKYRIFEELGFSADVACGLAAYLRHEIERELAVCPPPERAYLGYLRDRVTHMIMGIDTTGLA